ncbi:uncharacterized protein JCM6883_001824 [Sporobolomyces salmoneus]|uniref:uncharacterized protein n=1 Tax=Sporobolomyces salmoneus TaxID=183962 RepID=UPI003176901D
MEPQIYEGSPFAGYLRDADIPEPSLPATIPPSLHLEKLKYILATSALLSPSLCDALELYPPLKPNDKGKRKEVRTLEWPEDWESFGQNWQDRDAWDNARRFLQTWFEATRCLTMGNRPIARLYLPSHSRAIVETGQSGEGGGGGGVPRRVELASAREMEDFVEKAQQLDRRIEESLNRLETTQRYRAEHQQWETGSTTSDTPALLSASLPSSSAPTWPPRHRNEPIENSVDPFHPTDTYFGGLERKSSTRSNASAPSDRLPPTRHRLRPSVGTSGVFGVGTAAAAGPASPLLRGIERRSRRRPASMGGWIESSAVIPLSPSLGSIRRAERVGGKKEEEEEDQEELNVEADLRHAWETAHLSRKTFIWNLIATFEENNEGQRRWKEAETILVELAQGLDEITNRVERLSKIDRSKSDHLKTISVNLPSTTHRQTRHNLTSAPSSPSPRSASSPMIDQPNFAPPSAIVPTAQALSEYETRHASIGQSLECLQGTFASIISKTRLLSPPHQANSSTPHPHQQRVEELLKLHDSVKEELQNIANEWAKSRIALRQAVGANLKSKTTSSDAAPSRVAEVQVKEEVDGVEEDELDAEDAPPERDLNASLDDGRPIDDPDFSSRQAILDAALSSTTELGPGEDSTEKIFEAVAGGRERRNPGGSKLTREERVLRMKEARQALDAGKRAASTQGRGGENIESQLVGELRRVLQGLGKGVEVQ